MGRRKHSTARISLKCKREDKDAWELESREAGQTLSAYIIERVRQQQTVDKAISYTANALLDRLGLTTPNGSDHPHRPFSLENPTGLAAHRRCVLPENFGISGDEKKEGGEAARATGANESPGEGSETGQGLESPKNLAKPENFGEGGEGELGAALDRNWEASGLGEIGPGMGGVLDRLILRCGRSEAFEIWNRLGNVSDNPYLPEDYRAMPIDDLLRRAAGMDRLMAETPGVEVRPYAPKILAEADAMREWSMVELVGRDIDKLIYGAEFTEAQGQLLIDRIRARIRTRPADRFNSPDEELAHAARSVNAKLPAVPSGSPASKIRKVLDNGKSGGSALDDRGEGTPAGNVAGWRATRAGALPGRRQLNTSWLGSHGSESPVQQPVRGSDARNSRPDVGRDHQEGPSGDAVVGNQTREVSRSAEDSADAVSHPNATLELDDEELDEEEPSDEPVPTCPKCNAILPPEMICRSAKCQQAAIDEQTAMREKQTSVKPRKAPPRPNQGVTGSPVSMAAPEDPARKTAAQKFRDKFVKPKAGSA